MLDITDDSNPLYISKGNPGLKPSFTSNINMEYKTHSVKRHRTINAGAWFSTTSNSISNMASEYKLSVLHKSPSDSSKFQIYDAA